MDIEDEALLATPAIVNKGFDRSAAFYAIENSFVKQNISGIGNVNALFCATYGEFAAIFREYLGDVLERIITI